MSSATTRNSEAHREAREPTRDELSETELNTAFGAEFHIMKLVDKASPKL